MESKRITKVDGLTPLREQVRNAAAYVRVSTDSEKQQHSFASQYSYWKERISNDPKFKFAGVYADEGISGKNLRQRKAFLEMVDHAKAGKIDIIFVKSVTRFGRNLLDVMTTVRELRDEYGVVVYFEEEELYSDEPKADTYLTLKAMVAEQELKDMSEQQKWAIRARFEKGILNNNGRFYAFTLIDEGNGNKQLTPIPHEAEVVRLIYKLYLDGMTIIPIAKELTSRGILTPAGKTVWDKNTVVRILTNEKYMGDAMLQKLYHENFMPRINNRENPAVPIVYIEDNHEPIVDKETFRKVQEEMLKRRNKKLVGIKHERWDFKGFVKCGCCGTNYRHRVYQYKGKGLYGLLSCGKYLKDGKSGCSSNSIKESIMQELFVSAFNEFVVAESRNDSIKALESQINELKVCDDKLLSLYTGGYVDRLGYTVEHERLNREMAAISKQIAALSQDNIYKAFKKKITKYDGAMVSRFLKEAIVQDWTVAFVFKNGVTVTRTYTNGTSGNKPGWKQINQTQQKNEKE